MKKKKLPKHRVVVPLSTEELVVKSEGPGSTPRKRGFIY